LLGGQRVRGLHARLRGRPMFLPPIGGSGALAPLPPRGKKFVTGPACP
jgi:hypothetical protein